MTLPTFTVDLLTAAKRDKQLFPDWTEEQLLRGHNFYQKFFLLMSSKGQTGIVPTKDIDAFWHLHMLHPVAYYNDCLRIAGSLLDHKPSSRNPEEREELGRLFERTKILWSNEFGEQLEESASASCNKPCGYKCSSDCRSCKVR